MRRKERQGRDRASEEEAKWKRSEQEEEVNLARSKRREGRERRR